MEKWCGKTDVSGFMGIRRESSGRVRQSFGPISGGCVRLGEGHVDVNVVVRRKTRSGINAIQYLILDKSASSFFLLGNVHPRVLAYIFVDGARLRYGRLRGLTLESAKLVYRLRMLNSIFSIEDRGMA
jgi:hypothetical protein